MKLKIEDLAPYLPYGLKIKTNNQIREMLASELHHSYYTSINNVIEGVGHKPILRPLPFKDFTSRDYSYNEWIFFFEQHHDVFGLIEQGLAIDINTLKL